MRVVEHGAGPGVEDGEQAGPGSEMLGIGGELQQGGGGRDHEPSVNVFLMRPGERTKLGRQGEGDEEVGTRQQSRALLVEPAPGLIGMALGAVAVATGVVAVAPGAAVITSAQMSPEGRGAAGLEVAGPDGRA